MSAPTAEEALEVAHEHIVSLLDEIADLKEQLSAERQLRRLLEAERAIIRETVLAEVLKREGNQQ